MENWYSPPEFNETTINTFLQFALAIEMDDAEIVEALLTNSHVPRYQNRRDIPTEEFHFQMKLSLITFLDPDTNEPFNPHPSFFTPMSLMQALGRGHVDVVDVLLRHQEIVVEDWFYETLLQIAEVHLHMKVVDVFLYFSAKMMKEFGDGSVPMAIRKIYEKSFLIRLQVAAQLGDTVIAEELLSQLHKPDLENQCETRCHPLINAPKSNQVDVADILSGLKGLPTETSDVIGKRDKCEHKRSPLFLAAKYGHAELVDLLLRHQVIAYEDCSNFNPLHVAAGYGHVEVVEVFLNFSDKIRKEFGEEFREQENLFDISRCDRSQFYNKRDRNQYKAVLHFENMLDVRYRSTPFMLAVIHMQQKVVELLMKKGTLGAMRESVFDEHGHTALHIIIERAGHSRDIKKLQSYWDTINYLLLSRAFNVNVLDSKANTLLYWAAKCYEEDLYIIRPELAYKIRKPEPTKIWHNIVKLLLENGANVNQTNSKGKTPLMKASKRGYCQFVEVLLDWKEKSGIKLDFDLRDDKGETALIKAAANCRVQIVKLLLDNGASVNIYDNQGFTPLHKIIHEPNELWVDYYIFRNKFNEQKYINIKRVCCRLQNKYIQNTGNDRGSVEMHLITETCVEIEKKKETEKRAKDELIEIIFRNGHSKVDVQATDFRGATPLDIAVFSSLGISEQTFETLRMKSEQGGVENLGENDFLKIQKSLMEDRARTAIHRFAVDDFQYFDSEVKLQKDRIELEKVIGVMRNMVLFEPDNFEEIASYSDERGRTAIHHLIMSSNRDDYIPERTYNKPKEVRPTLELLLKIGCNLNATDKYGKTPLHYVHDQISDECYACLVERGADEDAIDNFGKTPENIRYFARHYENYDCRPTGKGLSENERSKRIKEHLHVRVLDFVAHLARAIGEKDLRFRCEPVLSGSSAGGTKKDVHGDFDFVLKLSELSKRCEVFPSPVSPKGFVHLKLKKSTSEMVGIFEEFFNQEQILLADQAKARFKIVLQDVLRDPDLWANEDAFQLNEYNETQRVKGLCITLTLEMLDPFIDKDNDLFISQVSVDLVPCIHLDGFWPEEALDRLSDQIKADGCILVFYSPQRYYPWVPF